MADSARDRAARARAAENRKRILAERIALARAGQSAPPPGPVAASLPSPWRGMGKMVTR